MHFSRLAVVALPILGAAANILPRTDCNGGTVKCCTEQYQTNNLPTWLVTFFNSIGVNVGSIGPIIGVDCLLESCGVNTVCCTGSNYQDGAINISTGCTPITA